MIFSLNSFKDFVESVLEEHLGYCTGMYAKYIAPNAEILRTENLVKGLLNVLDRAGVEYDGERIADLGPENRCASLPKYAKLVSYTEDMRRRIVQSEIELFDKYGFDKAIQLG